MTETRPSYYAYSQEVEGSLVKDDAPLASRFPYVQTAPDSIILVPIVQSGHTPGMPVCLHPVNLPGDVLGLCSTPTNESCPCCTNPVCTVHQSSKRMLFPEMPIPAHHQMPLLCETCAALGPVEQHALHTAVLLLNAGKDARP